MEELYFTSENGTNYKRMIARGTVRIYAFTWKGFDIRQSSSNLGINNTRIFHCCLGHRCRGVRILMED